MEAEARRSEEAAGLSTEALELERKKAAVTAGFSKFGLKAEEEVVAENEVEAELEVRHAMIFVLGFFEQNLFSVSKSISLASHVYLYL